MAIPALAGAVVIGSAAMVANADKSNQNMHGENMSNISTSEPTTNQKPKLK